MLAATNDQDLNKISGTDASSNKPGSQSAGMSLFTSGSPGRQTEQPSSPKQGRFSSFDPSLHSLRSKAALEVCMTLPVAYVCPAVCMCIETIALSSAVGCIGCTVCDGP